MRLEYETLLNPFPIALSNGTLVKPKLKDLADSTKKMSLEKLGYYETLIKMSPETFYTKIKGDEGKKYWNSLSEDERFDLKLFDVVLSDQKLIETFLDIFNLFFEEKVVFLDGIFLLLRSDVDSSDITPSDVRGVISDKSFPQVIDFIQQICCVKEEDEEDIDSLKFKNKTARRLYEKMLKAAKQKRKDQEKDINLTLANIISAVSNKHPTISPINVWELTIFQLLDAFNRLRVNSMYEIDSVRVSVWGDEKKTFNAALWYKNNYDKS